ncbi:unnamed protein product [Arabis nemorensis]|uniref:Uncharacterized protein n=1 Tax=Arabis nemorensis TaxID=586526 RepID=A0A565BUB7_9BRAS|nr:unnamed protein product [Arabis nemorensis]
MGIHHTICVDMVLERLRNALMVLGIYDVIHLYVVVAHRERVSLEPALFENNQNRRAFRINDKKGIAYCVWTKSDIPKQAVDSHINTRHLILLATSRQMKFFKAHINGETPNLGKTIIVFTRDYDYNFTITRLKNLGLRVILVTHGCKCKIKGVEKCRFSDMMNGNPVWRGTPWNPVVANHLAYIALEVMSLEYYKLPAIIDTACKKRALKPKPQNWFRGGSSSSHFRVHIEEKRRCVLSAPRFSKQLKIWLIIYINVRRV